MVPIQVSSLTPGIFHWHQTLYVWSTVMQIKMILCCHCHQHQHINQRQYFHLNLAFWAMVMVNVVSLLNIQDFFKNLFVVVHLKILRCTKQKQLTVPLNLQYVDVASALLPKMLAHFNYVYCEPDMDSIKALWKVLHYCNLVVYFMHFLLQQTLLFLHIRTKVREILWYKIVVNQIFEIHLMFNSWI